MKQYQRGKARARAEAITYQQEAADRAQSWGEVAYWCDYFQKLAKRYGLIKEFRENAII